MSWKGPKALNTALQKLQGPKTKPDMDGLKLPTDLWNKTRAHLKDKILTKYLLLKHKHHVQLSIV